MPTKVYGPEADEEHAPVHDSANRTRTSDKPWSAPPGHDVAANDPSDPRNDSINNSGGKGSQTAQGKAADSEPGEAQSSDSPDDENTLGKGFTALRSRTKLNLRKFLKKRYLAIAAPIAIFIAIIFFLLILASSIKLPDIMQEITTYEFARATSQFAKDSDEVTDESLALEATNDSAYQALKQNFTQTISNLYQNIRDTTWGRLDAYRPSQVIDTLGEDHGLSFNFKQSPLGRNVLTSVSIEDVDGALHNYEIPEVTSFAKWIPGLNSKLATKNATSFLSKSDFLSIVNEDMKADNISSVVRGASLSKIIGLAGGSRAGFALSRFLGLDEEDAQTEASIQTYEATQAGATISDNATTGEIASADSAVSNATSTEVNDWQPSSCNGGTTLVTYSSSGPGYCTTSTGTAGSSPPTSSPSSSELDQTVQTGVDTGAAEAADAALPSGLESAVLGYADPLYGIFTPACIIYDGSVNHSQPAIDNQMNQDEDAFDQLNAEAGEQEKGDQPGDNPNELATAIGGENAQLGSVTPSIPYMRSEGLNVDTSSTPSVEAGSDGTYTYSLVNAFGFSGVTATVANYIDSNFCPVLTSTTAAAAIAGANVAINIATFGQAGEGEEALSEGIVPFIQAYAKNVADKVVASFPQKEVTEGATTISQNLLSRTGSFIWEKGLNVAKPIAGIGALTVLAKLVVAARSNAATNGLAQNSNLVNEADDGAGIESNKVEQSQLFGAPLTAPNALQAAVQSSKYVDAQNASKSFTDRYFALSNADSLLSHVALDLNGEMSSGILNSVLKLGLVIFKPFNSIGSLLSLSGIASAGTPTSAITQDYGNVQFGWTQAEEKLINSNTSYKPLENQHILDEDKDGTIENEIAEKYSICFGYTYNPSGNGDLDPTDPNGNLQLSASDSLGNLLAGTALAPSFPGVVVSQPTTTGYIARDANGNVINTSSALCSPKNLSYNSPDPLADNPWSTNGKTHDLIFRWRLAMAYDTTLDQLISEQSVVSSAPYTPITPTAPLSTSSYQNPFRKIKNLGQSRVDQGVDYTGSGPVYAIGDGTVVNTTNSGWPGGTFIVYKLTDGPAAGKYVYMAENCDHINVSTSPPNNQVTSNTVLCTMVNSFPFIETGWANGSALGEAAASSVWIGHDSDSYYTAYGLNFSEFLQSLPSPPPPGIVYSGATELGSLPSGWPTTW